MIIKSGVVKSRYSLLSIVNYEIHKSLISKNRYRIKMRYYSLISNYWRRESSDNLELYGREAEIELTEENSPIKMDSVFEKFLINHIQEYYNDCEKEGKFKTIFYVSGTSVNQLMDRLPNLRQDLLLINIKNPAEQEEFLKNKTKKAY